MSVLKLHGNTLEAEKANADSYAEILPKMESSSTPNFVRIAESPKGGYNIEIHIPYSEDKICTIYELAVEQAKKVLQTERCTEHDVIPASFVGKITKKELVAILSYSLIDYANKLKEHQKWLQNCLEEMLTTL